MSPSMLQLVGKVFVIAIAVNFPWEMAQAYLYEPMGDWITATWRCLRAAIGDGAIVVAIAAAGIPVFRRRDWFRELSPARVLFTLAVGAAIAVVIEHLALKAGRWAYGPAMPAIPGLAVGLVPVMQMMILPLLVFLTVRRS